MIGKPYAPRRCYMLALVGQTSPMGRFDGFYVSLDIEEGTLEDALEALLPHDWYEAHIIETADELEVQS